jgi:hypothetical protein
MRFARTFLLMACLAVLIGVLSVMFHHRMHPSRSGPGQDGSSSFQPDAAAMTWTAISPSWTDKDMYSASHNREMGMLWNQVRTRQHWNAGDVDFIVYCIAAPPTFSGSDWNTADLQQNELAAKFMNTASIVSEHLRQGGTIAEGGIVKLKVALMHALESSVPLVRGYAALALIQTDFLGDHIVEQQVMSLADDPSDYVRSVLEIQLQNRSHRLGNIVKR